jgi:hypothetical protein
MTMTGMPAPGARRVIRFIPDLLGGVQIGRKSTEREEPGEQTLPLLTTHR